MITANMVFNMRLLQDLICDFINSFSIFFTIVSVRRVSHPFIICLIETTRSGAYMNIRFSRSHKPSLFMIVFENSGLSDMTNKTKNANAITKQTMLIHALLISKKKRRRDSPPIRLDQGLSTSPRQINLSPIIYQILYLSARIIYQIKELIWRNEATLLSPIFLRSPFLQSSTPLLLSSSIFLLSLSDPSLPSSHSILYISSTELSQYISIFFQNSAPKSFIASIAKWISCLMVYPERLQRRIRIYMVSEL